MATDLPACCPRCRADGLALLELDAAIELRALRYARRILLLEGFFAAAELPEIAARQLAVVVHHADQVRMLETARLARPLEVFLKINTGMNRLGVRPAAVAAIVERLAHCGAVATIRLMTHFARAEEPDGMRSSSPAFARRGATAGLSALDRHSAGVGRVRRSRRHRQAGIMLSGGTDLPARSTRIGVQP